MTSHTSQQPGSSAAGEKGRGAVFHRILSALKERHSRAPAIHNVRSHAASAKPSELYSTPVPSVRLTAFQPTHSLNHGSYKEAQGVPTTIPSTSYRPDYYPQPTHGDLTMDCSSENKATHIYKILHKDSFRGISLHSSDIVPDTGYQIRKRNAQTASLETFDLTNTQLVRKRTVHDKRNDDITPAVEGDQEPCVTTKHLKQAKLCVTNKKLATVIVEKEKEGRKSPFTPTAAGEFISITNLSCRENLTQVEHLLTSASEVAATLTFSDQSTQLRSINKAKRNPDNIEVDAVCFALSNTSDSQSPPHRVVITVNMEGAGSDYGDWCKRLLSDVLRSCRVIGYEVHELLTAIIRYYHIDDIKDILQWNVLDVGVAAFLLDPDNISPSYTHLLSSYKLSLTPHTSHLPTKSEVLGDDMTSLGSLMVALYHRLQEEKLWYLFTNIEMKVAPLLAVMEATGVLVDTTKLTHFSDVLKARIASVEKEAHKVAGHSFSINSTAQLRQVLYSELCLDQKCSHKLSKTSVQKFTSTSESVLIQLQDYHPLPRLVLQYRQLCKIKAAYIDGVLPYISQNTLRPCWQPTGAATGRLTCCNPNIQAFPKTPTSIETTRDGVSVSEVIDIRLAIRSRPGYTLVAADFKSIELRLLAHLSCDPTLLAVLQAPPSASTDDVFIMLSSEWLGMEPELVSASDREKTKRVVYAVVYGVGKERLAEMLHISADSAKNLMSSFLDKFSGVKEHILRVTENCQKTKYATTMCNRKRWFSHIDSTNYQLQSQSKRQAFNFHVQGSAADVCKVAMIEVSHQLAQASPHSRLLVQIHDELVYEVPSEDVIKVTKLLKTVLESPSLLTRYCTTALKVPLEVRVSTGDNWSALTATHVS